MDNLTKLVELVERRCRTTLSEKISAYVRLVRKFDEQWEDLNRYGADDCGSLVSHSQRREYLRFFQEIGLTPAELFRRVAERTSARWVYNNLCGPDYGQEEL